MGAPLPTPRLEGVDRMVALAGPHLGSERLEELDRTARILEAGEAGFLAVARAWVDGPVRERSAAWADEALETLAQVRPWALASAPSLNSPSVVTAAEFVRRHGLTEATWPETVLSKGAEAALERFLGTFSALESEADPARQRDLLVVEAIVLVRALEAERRPLLLDIPPAVAISIGRDDTYTSDYVLQVDVGGDDVYFNRAGGSGIYGCSLGGAAAAVLVDASGNDAYVGNHSCGSNGGGYYGVGFLLDLDGDDVYRAGSFATNGGGFFGSGNLVDLGGHDAYIAERGGVNGGASDGIGFLYDEAGNDNYAAGLGGTNGGAHEGRGLLMDWGGDDAYSGDNGAAGPGTGTLFDAGGNDAYSGGNGASGTGVGMLLDLGGSDSYAGENGASVGGLALLLDGDGDDRYVASGTPGNGAGFAGGAGFLFDFAGSDVYVGRPISNGAGDLGTGHLVDLSGNDWYFGSDFSSNGGGHGGRGMLLDFEGDDHYVAGSSSTNGGGGAAGAGALYDLRGSDVYVATFGGTNGGAAGEGSGALIDLEGDDTYAAGSVGTNGGGADGGAGLLLDFAGSDTYTAGSKGVNGGAAGGLLVSVGLLGDLGGRDSYFDEEGGSGVDRTVVPKGDVGAQLDAPS